MKTATRLLITWLLITLGASTVPFTAAAQDFPGQNTAGTSVWERLPHLEDLAFHKMKSLVGTYDEVDKNGEGARIDYKLISRDSALVENWTFANGKSEMTVFHMDNGKLIATHYCASGIQSTMTLENDSTPEAYNFTLRSATNFPDKSKAHNSGFGYNLSDLSSIDRTEIWTKDGEESLSEITMKRRDADAPQ